MHFLKAFHKSLFKNSKIHYAIKMNGLFQIQSKYSMLFRLFPLKEITYNSCNKTQAFKSVLLVKLWRLWFCYFKITRTWSVEAQKTSIDSKSFSNWWFLNKKSKENAQNFPENHSHFPYFFYLFHSIEINYYNKTCFLFSTANAWIYPEKQSYFPYIFTLISSKISAMLSYMTSIYLSNCT